MHHNMIDYENVLEKADSGSDLSMRTERRMLPELTEGYGGSSQVFIAGDSELGCKFMLNIQEYKGCVYYMDRSAEKPDEMVVGCIDLKAGTQTILDRFYCSMLRKVSRYSCLEYSGLEHEYGIHKSLSVSNDRIVYSTQKEIRCMKLDGSEKKTLLPSYDDCFYEFCLAVKDSIVYRTNLSKPYFRYDIATGQIETLTKSWKVVTGYTSSELILGNTLLYDIFSKKTTKITDLFPKLKRKEIVLLDPDRNVVYYIKKDYDWRENLIIGINREGDIVDVWGMPKMDEDIFEFELNREGHCTMCFDGRRLSVLLNRKEESRAMDDPNRECWIYTFDRKGNSIDTYRMSNGRFGGFHVMTEHAICFLFQRKQEKRGVLFNEVNKEFYLLGRWKRFKKKAEKSEDV